MHDLVEYFKIHIVYTVHVPSTSILTSSIISALIVYRLSSICASIICASVVSASIFFCHCWPEIGRPFRLTHAITRARANLSARAICHTHEKSYSAEKVLFHCVFLFQSFVFVYEHHLWIMRYMSIAYRSRWLWRPKRRPKWKVSFIGLFCVGIQFRFFWEPPKLIYTVYYFKC